MPSRNFIAREKSMPGFKTSKERGGIGRVGGREMQEGKDTGTYVYV